LNDAPPTLKRDLARIFSSGILNLGGGEFFKNTQTPFSLPMPQSKPNQQATVQPRLDAHASAGPGGMVRNVIVGSMPGGGPIYCSGLCSK
jgi:hypothetical protein